MWKPKVKKMNGFVKFITGGWALAITLLPFGIYVNKDYWYWQEHNVIKWNETINHESTHWEQQKEMLVTGIFIAVILGIIFVLLKLSLWWLLALALIPFLFFYLWYLIEWFFKLFVHGREAYYNISFEREAIDNEKNLEYLKTRRHFAWLVDIIRKK